MQTPHSLSFGSYRAPNIAGVLGFNEPKYTLQTPFSKDFQLELLNSKLLRQTDSVQLM